MALAVHAFADEAAPAGRLATALGVPLGIVNLHRFPDGECLPTAPPSPPTVIAYVSLDRADAKLAPLLLAADAWRRRGVRRLVLVTPYLGYLRQDAVFAPGQPLSRDVILPLIGARFDRVVTVQAHLHRTTDLAAVMGAAAQSLEAVSALAPLLSGDEPPLIVGPDAESAPWVADWAAATRGEGATFSKTRLGDRNVRLSADWLEGAHGRRVVLVDDVASSGATLAHAVRRLVRAGAASVDVAVVHALFDRRAEGRLRRAGARRILSTDSVAHPTNAVSLAPLLAQALKDELSA